MDKQKNRIFLHCSGSVVTNIDYDRKKVLAAIGKAQDFDVDLVPVEFKLVHANTNKNKDAFTEEDLRAAASTPTLKPLNWQHDPKDIIGVIIDSNFVGASAEEDAHLLVTAVVYRYLFPDQAIEMAERFEKEELFFSMEVWYTEAECSTCGSLSNNPNDYCSHLKGRHNQGSATSRILRGITFGGVGVVENPADVEAIATDFGRKEDEEQETADQRAAAEKEEDDMIIKDGLITFETQAQLDSYVKEQVDKQLAENEAGKKVEELTAKVAEMEDAAKTAEAENQAVSKELEDLKASMDEVKDQKEEAEKELKALKEEAEAKIRIEARLKQLADSGFELPEEEDARGKLIKSYAEMTDEAFEGYLSVLVATAAKIPTSDKDGDTEDADGNPPIEEPGKSLAGVGDNAFPNLRKAFLK